MLCRFEADVRRHVDEPARSRDRAAGAWLISKLAKVSQRQRCADSRPRYNAILAIWSASPEPPSVREAAEELAVTSSSPLDFDPYSQALSKLQRGLEPEFHA
jgi:hypothetical protein